MGNLKKILLILLLLSTSLSALPKGENNGTKPLTPFDTMGQALKEQFSKKKRLSIKNIGNKKSLRKIYLKNHFTPLWITPKGLNREKIQKLSETISNDLTLSREGLIYQHNQTLTSAVDNNLSQKELFELELKLTSHYYNFLQYRLYGAIQWNVFSKKLKGLKRYKINAHWLRYRPNLNLINLIGHPNIDTTLEEIKPKNFGYDALLQALEKLTDIKKEGGWKQLPYFKRLKIGSSGDIVKQLRERLINSGDYRVCPEVKKKPQENNESNTTDTLRIDKEAVFDTCLDGAVKRFQKRHGLVVDGIVGGGTRKALNMTVDEKIKKVLLNIDRIKWLPRTEDKRYLIVNIPEFMLHYVEYGRVTKELAVIVGDTRHPTPIFSEKISYIVLNPYWKVPEGIVKREIIPAMIKNPNYLRRQGIEAHTTWSERSPVVNVSGLFWEDYLYEGSVFPYRLMQPPGPRNALGKIKFKFPNRFAVYLHDTPTRYLFKKTKRAFSHGCVRLSHPESLLETIATFNKDINMTRAKIQLKGKRKKQLNITNKLPINLIYLTAGMNEGGELLFRNDIYRYDEYQKRSIR